MKDEIINVIISVISGLLILIGIIWLSIIMDEYNLIDIFIYGCIFLFGWFAMTVCSYLVIRIIRGDPY